MIFALLSIFGYAQNSEDGYVGVNIEVPKATLDIKSHNDNTNQILRFSTEPTDIDPSKDYVLFAGVENDGGYDLRIIDIDDILDREIPPVNRFIATNSKSQNYVGRNGNFTITLALQRDL